MRHIQSLISKTFRAELLNMRFRSIGKTEGEVVHRAVVAVLGHEHFTSQ